MKTIKITDVSFYVSAVDLEISICQKYAALLQILKMYVCVDHDYGFKKLGDSESLFLHFNICLYVR